MRLLLLFSLLTNSCQAFSKLMGWFPYSGSGSETLVASSTFGCSVSVGGGVLLKSFSEGILLVSYAGFMSFAASLGSDFLITGCTVGVDT